MADSFRVLTVSYVLAEIWHRDMFLNKLTTRVLELFLLIQSYLKESKCRRSFPELLVRTSNLKRHSSYNKKKNFAKTKILVSGFFNKLPWKLIIIK
jgi:hypothetical protein